MCFQPKSPFTIVAASPTYTYLGCWTDSADRAISGEWFYISTNADVVELCAEHALSLGYSVFAVQAQHYCFTSYDAWNTYDSQGRSTACESNGRGGGWANAVYVIRAECEYIRLSDKKNPRFDNTTAVLTDA